MPSGLGDSIKRRHLLVSQDSNRNNCVKELGEIYMRTSVASFFESLWTSCSADIASEFQGNDNRNQTNEYPIHMHEGQGILSWGLRTKQLQLQRDSKTHQHAVHHTISLPQLLRERYRLLRPKLHPTLLDPSQLPQFAWRERKPWVKYQC